MALVPKIFKLPGGYREWGMLTKQPEASIMKWIFEQLAEGTYSGEQILHSAREKGFTCSKITFIRL